MQNDKNIENYVTFNVLVSDLLDTVFFVFLLDSPGKSVEQEECRKYRSATKEIKIVLQLQRFADFLMLKTNYQNP